MQDEVWNFLGLTVSELDSNSIQKMILKRVRI